MKARKSNIFKTAGIILLILLLILALAVTAFTMFKGHYLAGRLLGLDPVQAEEQPDQTESMTHEHTWEDGICTICEEECDHNWTDGVCTKCGKHCSHEVFDGNMCKECGFECDHDWRRGVCKLCGYVCPHSMHDSKTHVCLDCGQLVTHHYVSGRCTICATTPRFSYNVLPDDYYTICEQQGTVEEIEYKTQYYASGRALTKTAHVYLPYNYDSEGQYNVLFVVHGLGGTSRAMISQQISYDGQTYCMQNLYDRMIMEKDCEPFIVVGINTRIREYESMYEQIALELKNDLIPYIVEHYATYAENSSLDAIKAARQHFGMAGLSMGSIYTFNSGLAMDLDVFGNFAAFAGNSDPQMVAKKANEELLSKYPIYCLFSGSGIVDGGQGQQFEAYQWIYESTPRLQSGINSFYVSPEGGHEWKVWVTQMYNALQVMFQGLDGV